MVIKICSQNVRGLANKDKREKVFVWLKEQSISIALLQETHSTDTVANTWRQEWDGETFFSGNDTKSKGVAFLINKNLSCKIIKHEELIVGRLHTLELEINDHTITIINVYGPNTDDTSVFKKLEEYLRENDDKSIIAGGDFNTILNVDIDKKNGIKNNHPNIRTKLLSIIEENNLTDIWRTQHQDKQQFTWHSSTRPVIFSRLDYFLLSDNLINFVKNSNIKPGYKTDHSLINVELNFDLIERGKGIFKLNNSILLETEYQTKIKQGIKSTAEINKEANPNTLWELIKGTVRNETIQYTCKKKKTEKEQENKLQSDVRNLEENISKIESQNELDVLREDLKIKQSELDTLLDNRINGIIVRSKANKIEYNEKNSKYFSNLEKKRSEQKTITHLNINGKHVTNQQEIRQEQKQFYETLYEKRETTDSTINFFDDDMHKLNNEDKTQLEGLLTEYECANALKQMQNGKSPGSDGITTEFYKIFWNDIKRYYIKSINHSFHTKQMTELQNQGLLTLLPKQDKDISQLGNWRPICLLNIDFKIATKAIANRIKPILPKIIDASQTGFIKGRYIGENIRLISDIINKVNEDDLPGTIFFSDFEKAFDSLDHEFMYACLRHLNFGNDLIEWVRLFYAAPKNSVLNNGHMTDFFKVKRGVRQGCPLSPYLFIICIEMLSNEIATNKNIKGQFVAGKEVKRSLFADDATFITDGSKLSFETLINVFDNFSHVSGLKLNSSKCNVLRIGSSRYTNVKYLENKRFAWTSDKSKALGIIFYNDYIKFVTENFSSKLNNFIVTLKRWQHRKLTLLGKITVIKTFALPKLIYVLSNIECPNQTMINEITKSMFSFLWDSKPDKINRQRLTSEYENGGLKMIDINMFITSLKCSWIKRFMDENNRGQWKTLYLDIIEKYGGKLIFECDLNKEIITDMFKESRFITEILSLWSTIKKHERPKEISSHILWNNQNIMINKKTIFKLSWFEKGIKHVSDIYDYRQKHFYDFNTLKYLYNLPTNDVFFYNQLKTCIPKKWRLELKKEEANNLRPGQNTQNIYADFINSKQSSKFLYHYQLKQQDKYAPKSKAEEKWSTELNKQDINWKKVYTNTFSSTIDNELRNFQYKYLTRIVPTNKTLFKYGIKNSNLCDFCNMNIETLSHLFWECPRVQEFWNNISKLLQSVEININLNFETISLGISENTQNQRHKIGNFIIIFSKRFLFRTKYLKEIPNYAMFKNCLLKRIKIEKIIAINKDKQNVHDMKWTPFIDKLK